MHETHRRRAAVWLAGTLLALGACAGLLVWRLFFMVPRWHTALELGLATVYSPLDRDGDGVDDYTDLVLGARLDAERRPRYDGRYWDEGYPPDDVGVCTDVIWRAFAHAGYDLRAMVDADIAANVEAYPRVEGRPDSNIDFRRVKNLQVFFARHALELTLDLTDVEAWQPGDIVVFAGGTDHIAVVSDRRRRDGVPWLIHNGGQPLREEDCFRRLLLLGEIVGHYRWTGDRDAQILISWTGEGPPESPAPCAQQGREGRRVPGEDQSTCRLRGIRCRDRA